MKSILKDILIGIIIGAGKIIPGVSGSVLAITLGVYERIIYSINNIFNYKNIYYLSKIGFGIIISIVFLSKIIIYLLSNYYTYTIFVFVGLILGSIKSIATNTSFKYYYLTILSFIIIVILGLININSNNHNGIFYYLLSGFIESVSSIIPGISGTALLMLIGTYNMVIDIFSNIVSIKYLVSNINIVIPFIIGIILGLVISIKVIGYLFSKYKTITYNIILGLLLGSIFIMLKKCNYNVFNILIGIILLIISYISIKKVNHFFWLTNIMTHKPIIINPSPIRLKLVSFNISKAVTIRIIPITTQNVILFFTWTISF